MRPWRMWHTHTTPPELCVHTPTHAWISGRAVRTIAHRLSLDGGYIVDSKKIAVVAVLCAIVALVACRREEYVPMKLGAPAEQPAR
jgi:hypothetical protein